MIHLPVSLFYLDMCLESSTFVEMINVTVSLAQMALKGSISFDDRPSEAQPHELVFSSTAESSHKNQYNICFFDIFNSLVV
jgi:hypothetical protein